MTLSPGSVGTFFFNRGATEDDLEMDQVTLREQTDLSSSELIRSPHKAISV